MFKSKLIHIEPRVVQPDLGHAFIVDLPETIPLGDRDEFRNSSMVRVFEDGGEIGPAHSTHEVIRRYGGGRYCHWRKQLWFSSSDNTSPKRNRRRYDVYVPAEMFSDTEQNKLLQALTVDVENLPDFEKFLLARDLFVSIWPHSRMPDIGRRIDHDSEFEADFRRHKPESDLSYERTYNLDQLSQLALNVPGDVAECGTYRGGSAYFLARRMLNQRDRRTLHLFDSFGGLSQPGPADGDWWQEGDLSSSPEDVAENIAAIGDTSFVKIYPGWIPERFSEIAGHSFCLVHVDVDLYQPTLDCIAFFYPRLNRGGIIVLDDYGHKSCPGVTKAVDEYMQARHEPIINLAAGGAFIVKV